MSKVLMTGHNGYIGSVMASVFVEAGHDVTGLDTDYFGSCSLVRGRRRRAGDHARTFATSRRPTSRASTPSCTWRR